MKEVQKIYDEMLSHIHIESLLFQKQKRANTSDNVESEELICFRWGFKLVRPLGKIVCWSLKHLKTGLLND